MSVRTWLEGLCLSRYHDLLVANGYETIEKCYGLTSGELDRIGISLPGHKKRILYHLLKKSSQSQSTEEGPVTPVVQYVSLLIM